MPLAVLPEGTRSSILSVPARRAGRLPATRQTDVETSWTRQDRPRAPRHRTFLGERRPAAEARVAGSSRIPGLEP